MNRRDKFKRWLKEGQAQVIVQSPTRGQSCSGSLIINAEIILTEGWKDPFWTVKLDDDKVHADRGAHLRTSIGLNNVSEGEHKVTIECRAIKDTQRQGHPVMDPRIFKEERIIRVVASNP